MRASIVVGILILAVVLPGAQAQQVFLVDAAGNGDFREIQPAIDAAVDGDKILVRDTGAYAEFTLDKGVMIRASGSRFRVAPGEIALIEGTVEGQRSGIAGFTAVAAELRYRDRAPLEVRDCEGEVVLEDILFESSPTVLREPSSLLKVVRSFDVSVDELTIEGSEAVDLGAHRTTVVYVIQSQVRFTGIDVQGYCGPRSTCEDAVNHGGRALRLRQSLVTVANPRIRGGHGGDYDPDRSGCSGVPGMGGDGVLSQASQVLIMGRETDWVIGGDGGADLETGETSPSGDGIGVTTQVVTASRVFVSSVDTYSSGVFVRDDSMASLVVTPRLRLGDESEVDVDAIEPGEALLALSNLGGFLALGSFIGPPLSAVPGSVFLVLPIGATDAAGDLTWSHQLGSDPALVGVAFVYQVGVLAHSGTDFLTNAVTRVIGE